MTNCSRHIYDPVVYDAFVQPAVRDPIPATCPDAPMCLGATAIPIDVRRASPRILMCWLQRRYLESDVEEPLASPTRALRSVARPANPGLRVLRPTGTG